MPQFDTDRRAVLERMREANVTQAVIVATEEREIELVEALAKDQEGLFTAFAVSPQDETLPELTAEEIAQRMLRPKMVAVGETGLDYHYCHEPLDWQRRRFGTHIDAAKIARKPLIIHSREAQDDTIAILKAHVLETVVSFCIASAATGTLPDRLLIWEGISLFQAL